MEHTAASGFFSLQAYGGFGFFRTVFQCVVEKDREQLADRGLVSVTVVSSDGTYADGLSTSLFVMGEEKAEAFWRGHSDLFQMVLLTDGGELLATDGLKGSFQSDLPIRWISGT